LHTWFCVADTAPHGQTCGGYWGMLGHEATDSAMYASWGIVSTVHIVLHNCISISAFVLHPDGHHLNLRLDLRISSARVWGPICDDVSFRT
jgi:hypothetical protein